MKKVFFFALPSVSVHNSLLPVLEQLCIDGYEVVYYNTAEYGERPRQHVQFRPYPSSFQGHYSDTITSTTSYFEFAQILVGAASSIADFLVQEVKREAPALIIHSHLALWGKLVAKACGLPHVAFYTTFVLDERIMLPFFREQQTAHSQPLNHVHEALTYMRKSSQLYKRLGLRAKPNIWDAYINTADLNLLFIEGCFQPGRQLFGPTHHWVGYPTQPEPAPQKQNLIYVSMGTVVKQEVAFFGMLINLFKALPAYRVVLSVGHAYAQVVEALDIPEHIEVQPHVNQKAVLKAARLFITRGGMASVHEALYTQTPMVVVPVIPEQQLTARRIAELGMGLQLNEADVTPTALAAAVQQVLDNYTAFEANMNEAFGAIAPVGATHQAVALIEQLLAAPVATAQATNLALP